MLDEAPLTLCLASRVASCLRAPGGATHLLESSATAHHLRWRISTGAGQGEEVRDEVYVIESSVTEFAKHPEKTHKSLAREALLSVLADARLAGGGSIGSVSRVWTTSWSTRRASRAAGELGEPRPIGLTQTSCCRCLFGIMVASMCGRYCVNQARKTKTRSA